jgi:tetratricopeptide (TPR) repeat protein
MKQLIFCFILITSSTAMFAQERALEKNHQEGIDKAKKGDYIGAISSFSKAIEVLPLDAYAWYNRGMAKNMIGEYQDALNDFGTCIGLNPAYGRVWYNRGITKMYVANYDGAIVDLTQAIQIEREYAGAYYYRAYLYELKGLFDFACTDYQNAQAKGYPVPAEKLAACRDTSYQGLIKHPLLFLTKESSMRSYGTKKSNPIHIGNTVNMEIYLRLLRSPDGKYVYHNVVEQGDLSVVEINYTKHGKKKSKLLYFDLDVLEDPKIIKGFKTFN